jgi:tryptophan synthase alpha chain
MALSTSQSRIAACFTNLKAQKRQALIPYIMAGDPSLDVTAALLHAFVDAGVDVIELGIPFSDPMADGPVVQLAAERALVNGVSLGDVLDMVATFRKTNNTTPIVLMGYANPIERMGIQTFAERASAAGVDGVLIVDYPPEESVTLHPIFTGAGLDMIFLLSPTSSDTRVKLVCAIASGYIYYVSLKGVTGAGNLDTAAVEIKVGNIKAHTSLPVGVGFGIRDGATAKQIAGFADAVVIGSRIIQELESVGAEAKAMKLDAAATHKLLVAKTSAWVSTIRSAMDA